MTFRQAEMDEFDRVRGFYWALIDVMEGGRFDPGWRNGIYPSDADRAWPGAWSPSAWPRRAKRAPSACGWTSSAATNRPSGCIWEQVFASWPPGHVL